LVVLLSATKIAPRGASPTNLPLFNLLWRRLLRAILGGIASALGPLDTGLGAPSTRLGRQAGPALTSRGLNDGTLVRGKRGQDHVKGGLYFSPGAATASPAARLPVQRRKHDTFKLLHEIGDSITVALLSSSTSLALSRAIFTFHFVSSSFVATNDLSFTACKPTIYVVFC
jgi:hypothetical protein